MTICRKCGTSNQDDKKFCVFCHELLIADPVEMEKRAAAEHKKQQKALKKLNAKHKRWKRALFLLIPIGVLDFLDLLLCLDLAFIGVGNMLGGLVGELLGDLIGSVINLFGNDVYTDQTVQFVVRGLELLGALGLLLIASVLAIVMIVRMIKWRRYCKNGDAQEEAINQAMQNAQGAQGATPGASEQVAEASVQEQSVEQVKVAMGEQGVCYDALAQLDDQMQEYIMPEPENETDCKQMFGALTAHLWEYDEDSVRRILSAMSASRMLLCSAGALDSAAIFDNLSRAFGVKAQQFTCPEADAESEGSIARVLLQRDEQTGALVHTSFTKSLYAARYSPRNVCLAGVGGIGAGAVNAVFSPFAAYFGVPEGNAALYLGEPSAQGAKPPCGIEDGKMILPSNLWVLGVLPEQDRVTAVGGDVARYTAAIYLRNSGKAFSPEGAEDAKAVNVSVDAFERAVAAAENAYYLSDELWQVIDAVEKQMTEAGGAGLANRTLRMFEKYTAVYLACGGKQTDAFDNGFAAVIVPACAAQLRALAGKTEGESLSALLERMVGREKLPMTVEVLTSMELI